MKKPLLRYIPLVLLTAFFTINSNAQDKNSTTQFGIKGGFNASNLYSNDSNNDEHYLYGFNAGVYATFPISDMIAIQPEILYTNKGSKVEYNDAVGSVSQKFKLNYIEVPVLFRVDVVKFFSIQAGGYASYLVDSKISNEGTIKVEREVDTDDLKKFDAGIAFGVAFDFSPISIGVRYNYGLLNVGKERTIAGQTFTYPDVKNSSLNAYIAVKLN